ncbi:hypothetical protein Adt_12035 [Abeliophyllum distichum]|uniref:Uncharacterized protein n=1 Tax=Abeliophyllum distichum TaxID=126358 RepID=A0ABD1UPL6_9LAMI
MEFPPRTDPNAPDRPPKPPDVPSTTIGHLPSALPNPQTGLTPLESGLTPTKSLPFAAALGLNPSDAAAISTGYAPTGPPPVSSPSAGGQFDGSFEGQRLAPAILEPGPTRGLPHTHVSTHGSNPVSLSLAPNWVELPPALDV